MPTPLRDEHRLLTRRRLIDAAVHEFAENGYSSTTVSGITAAAHVNRATFYGHFRAKRDIFIAAMHDAAEDVDPYMRELGTAIEVADNAAVERWLDDALLRWDDSTRLTLALHEALAVDPSQSVIRTTEIRRMAASLTSQNLRRYDEAEHPAVRHKIALLLETANLAWLHLQPPRVFADIERRAVVGSLAAIWCATLNIPRSS